MTLVEGGRVRAARLEAASSKLYFECQPAAAAAGAAAQASTAAAQKSTSSSKQAQQAAAATAAAAGAGTAAAVLPAAAKQPLRRSFYVKLADRHDPVLVGKILTAGAGIESSIADVCESRIPTGCVLLLAAQHVSLDGVLVVARAARCGARQQAKLRMQGFCRGH
jgi:hypothetical protein